MIVVIDYGAGNIRSVMNMLKSLGAKARIAENGPALDGASRLILPGVGHFDHGMTGLASRGFVDALNEKVLQDRLPTLGICLGAQLIARGSEEGDCPGLGWVAADVVAFDKTRLSTSLRVPHMGWAETWAHKPAATEGLLPQAISAALSDQSRFYYVHGFHLLCDDPESAVLRAHHGYEFAAGVVSGNVLGFQFHPEKSHAHGKRILNAFLEWQPSTTS
jgi:glutamine amidotransferase